MSKFNSNCAFITVIGVIIYSVEVFANDIRSLDCYDCVEDFEDTDNIQNLTAGWCVGSVLYKSLKNRSTVRYWKGPKEDDSIVCEVSLTVSVNRQPATPGVLEFFLRRNLAVERLYSSDQLPKPGEKLLCRQFKDKDLSERGLVPLKAAGIACTCTSDGCNNLSIDQMLKKVSAYYPPGLQKYVPISSLNIK